MPRSLAIRRASGDALARSPPAGSAGELPPAALGRSASPAGGAGCGGLAREDASRRRRRRGPPQPRQDPRPSAWSLSRIPDPRDRRPDRQRLALLRQDLRQRPRHVAFVGHVRLVGLDLDQLVADRDLVPDLLQPLQDRPLLHRVREPRHDDVGHQIDPSSAASAALTTCSSCGIAACSSRFE